MEKTIEVQKTCSGIAYSEVSMTDFPLTRALGIVPQRPTTCYGHEQWVPAEQIENVLAKAQRVYGFGVSDGAPWSKCRDNIPEQTHTALLIGIEKIERAVTEKEINELIECRDLVTNSTYRQLLNRILQHGYRSER